VENVVFQIGTHAVKAISISTAIAVGCSYAPGEPNVVSNYVHTKTFFGRGYDYTIENGSLRLKGDIVTGVLGTSGMMGAVQKYAPDSNIINMEQLNNILNDPEFKSKILKNTTVAEKAALGIPLFDIFPFSFALPSLTPFTSTLPHRLILPYFLLLTIRILVFQMYLAWKAMLIILRTHLQREMIQDRYRKRMIDLSSNVVTRVNRKSLITFLLRR